MNAAIALEEIAKLAKKQQKDLTEGGVWNQDELKDRLKGILLNVGKT